MKALVEPDGVWVPRRMLPGVKEVQIRKVGRTVVIEPSAPAADPMFELGRRPVDLGLADAAEHHDAYLNSAL